MCLKGTVVSKSASAKKVQSKNVGYRKLGVIMILCITDDTKK